MREGWFVLVRKTDRRLYPLTEPDGALQIFSSQDEACEAAESQNGTVIGYGVYEATPHYEIH